MAATAIAGGTSDATGATIDVDCCWTGGATAAGPVTDTETAVCAVATAVAATAAVVFAGATADRSAVADPLASGAESVLICAGEATAAAAAGALAAIAAAAIASGAVALPDEAGAAGTLAGAVVTGIATATGVGIISGAPACSAAAGSVAGVASEAGFAVDFELSAFKPLDLVLALAFWFASLLALGSASPSDAWPASVWSFAAFCVSWSTGAASRGRGLFALA
jgi:hypothetical protein